MKNWEVVCFKCHCYCCYWRPMCRNHDNNRQSIFKEVFHCCLLLNSSFKIKKCPQLFLTNPSLKLPPVWVCASHFFIHSFIHLGSHHWSKGAGAACAKLSPDRGWGESIGQKEWNVKHASSVLTSTVVLSPQFLFLASCNLLIFCKMVACRHRQKGERTINTRYCTEL